MPNYACALSVELPEGVVVMDAAKGDYVLLGESASLLWVGVVAGEDVRTLSERLVERYGLDAETAEADAAEFLQSCRMKQLITATSPEASSNPRVRAAPAARRWLALRAWWLLATTAVGLRRARFEDVYAKARVGLTGAVMADEKQRERAIAAFRTAENFFVLRQAPDDCLPRSLALFRFLRLCGLEAGHVIGVRQNPFSAHAWVELGGRPVLDTTDRTKHYVALARL